MNAPINSTKHICLPECRQLSLPYFQNPEKKQGYTFITLFRVNPENSTFETKLQTGDFRNLAEKNTLLILRKPNDSIEVIKVDSTRYLRIDEFELVRRCLEGYKSLEDLMRASTFNPVASTVYGWLMAAKQENHLYSKSFYEDIRSAFMEADLEAIYKADWLK